MDYLKNNEKEADGLYHIHTEYCDLVKDKLTYMQISYNDAKLLMKMNKDITHCKKCMSAGIDFNYLSNCR